MKNSVGGGKSFRNEEREQKKWWITKKLTYFFFGQKMFCSGVLNYHPKTPKKISKVKSGGLTKKREKKI